MCQDKRIMFIGDFRQNSTNADGITGINRKICTISTLYTVGEKSQIGFLSLQHSMHCLSIVALPMVALIFCIELESNRCVLIPSSVFLLVFDDEVAFSDYNNNIINNDKSLLVV